MTDSIPNATRALLDVWRERNRQIEEEGFTPHGDDHMRAGELATAGGLYAEMAIRGDNDQRYRGNGFPPPGWPWPARWWKPMAGPRRMLVKAASLIIAEIERLDRQAS